MALYCEQKKIDVFRFLPLTFTLQTTTDGCMTEITKFLQFFQSLNNEEPCDKIIEQTNSKLGSSMQLPLFFKFADKGRGA